MNVVRISKSDQDKLLTDPNCFLESGLDFQLQLIIANSVDIVLAEQLVSLTSDSTPRSGSSDLRHLEQIFGENKLSQVSQIGCVFVFNSEVS